MRHAAPCEKKLSLTTSNPKSEAFPQPYKLLDGTYSISENFTFITKYINNGVLCRLNNQEFIISNENVVVNSNIIPISKDNEVIIFLEDPTS